MSDSKRKHWKKVEDLFSRALELPRQDRKVFVETEAGDDQLLLAAVLGLLDADASKDPINEIVQKAASKSVSNDPDKLLDKQIGNYRLLSLLGEGGMGSVYLAERSDEQFQQQVAIKVLNSYRPSKNLIQRFRAERQILANLDHPNIAKLLDGGETDEGLPYLVMEYVAGEPITEYCDQNRLSTRVRLGLFEDVCDAVQHAHQNLVIHRDIKPSNIIVNNDGVPKLLDFGIAKLMRPEDLQQTVAVTMDSARLLTPGHASPEQVRGETITTATDVYSLGVLLYQLLTGQFPFEITSYRPADIERVICDSIPSRPSTRIEQSATDESATGQSQATNARATTPRKLAKQLRGDLDNIVLVAMRKEASRRYATVRQLQQDISNYLNNRPVRARSESFGYLASKFVRRNRSGVAAGAIFMAVIVALSGYYTINLTRQRDIARLEASKAVEISSFLTDLFAEADPRFSLGEQMSPKQMLDRGAARITDELATQPELQAALMATIGESYNQLNDQKAAKAHLERSLAAISPLLDADHPDINRMRYLLGIANVILGDVAESLEIHRANYARQSRLHGERSLEAARELNQIAYAQAQQNDYEIAERNFLEAMQIFRDLGDDGQDDLSRSILDYGVVLRTLDRFAEEEPLILEALSIQESRVGNQHPDYSGVLNNVGNHYYERGLLTEAEKYMSEHVAVRLKNYGEKGIPYGVALMNYSNLLMLMNRDEEALIMMEQTADIYAETLGEDVARYAFMLENKANLLLKMKRFEEAEPLFIEVLQRMERLFGRDHYDYVFSENNYAGFLMATERWEEAAPLLRHCVQVYTNAFGANNSETANAQMRLARTLRELGNLEEAMINAATALKLLRATHTEPHTRLVAAIRTTAIIHRKRGEYPDADTLFTEAIELAGRIEVSPVRQAVATESELTESLIAQSRFAEAEQMLLERFEQLQAMGETQAGNLASTSASLHKLYLAWGKPELAEPFSIEDR